MGTGRVRGRGDAAQPGDLDGARLAASDGSIAYLYYADRLNQLPLGVVGIAVGTAILPPLSRQVRLGGARGAVVTQNRGVELALC